MRKPAKLAIAVFGLWLGLGATTRAGGLALDFTGGSVATTVGDLTNGWSFTLAGTTTVDELGIFAGGNDPLTQDHQVGIWDGSGNLVASVTVTNANSTAISSTDSHGRWLFTDITPVILAAGSYVIGAGYSTGPDALLFQTNAPTMAAGVMYGESRSVQGILNEPTQHFPNDGNGWFGPNFRIATPAAVPEPSTLVMGGTGLAAILSVYYLYRRRSNSPRPSDSLRKDLSSSEIPASARPQC